MKKKLKLPYAVTGIFDAKSHLKKRDGTLLKLLCASLLPLPFCANGRGDVVTFDSLTGNREVSAFEDGNLVASGLLMFTSGKVDIQEYTAPGLGSFSVAVNESYVPNFSSSYTIRFAPASSGSFTAVDSITLGIYNRGESGSGGGFVSDGGGTVNLGGVIATLPTPTQPFQISTIVIPLGFSNTSGFSISIPASTIGNENDVFIDNLVANWTTDTNPNPNTGIAIWAQPQSGNWSTQANWIQNVVPASGVDTFFSTHSSSLYTVTLTDPSAAKNLTVQGDQVELKLASNTLNVGGTLTVESFGSQPGVLLLSGPGTISAAGGVTVTSNAALAGNVKIVGNVFNSGVVQPGINPGAMTINGNYVQSPSGLLNIRVNGSSASGSFDTLDIAGNATIAGNLPVTTPGSSSAPGFLPYDDNYAIISAGSVSGSFSNASAVVQTTYASDGKTSGVFKVKYDSNGVTLSNFHQIHVLTFGLDDYNANGTPPGYTITGQDGATRVTGAFFDVPGVVDIKEVQVNSNDSGNSSNNEQLLANAISNEKVHPGDTFVFYINTHGTYNENPDEPYDEASTTRQQGRLLPNEVSNSETELFLSADNASEQLTARQFAGLFQGSKWTNVNKLFLMDTCYSGGFWSGVGTNNQSIPYLAGLSHSAIIAASPEDLLSWGTIGSGGDLGTATANALEEADGKELTFDDLFNDIYDQDQMIVPGNNDFVQGGPAGGWGVPMDGGGDTLYGAATSDFTLGIAGSTTALPEPSYTTIATLFGIVCLGRRQRVRTA